MTKRQRPPGGWNNPQGCPTKEEIRLAAERLSKASRNAKTITNMAVAAGIADALRWTCGEPNEFQDLLDDLYADDKKREAAC